MRVAPAASAILEVARMETFVRGVLRCCRPVYDTTSRLATGRGDSARGYYYTIYPSQRSSRIAD